MNKIQLKLKLKVAANRGRESTLATYPHLVVIACAGTGKTTTLIEGLRLLRGLKPSITPSLQQEAIWEQILLSKGVKNVCFVAFNKSIATELKRRVPKGCQAMTMHSMGLKAVTQYFGRVAIESDRVQELIALELGKDLQDLRKKEFQLMVCVDRLVGLCKVNLLEGSAEDIDHLTSHYEIEMNGHQSRVVDLVPRILNRCKDVQADNRIDFNDMIWLPVVLNLKVFEYDLLLVDEAQDLNKCQQQLAIKAGHRLIFVGDSKQAIYGFAGADSQSIPNLIKKLGACMTCGGTGWIKGKTHLDDLPCVKCDDRNPLNKDRTKFCVTLPLTVTYRCGKAIVAEAQKYVSYFEAHESNGEGLITRRPLEDLSDDEGNNCPDYRSYVEYGDMVLCRCNGPLVQQCFKFLRTGRKATIQGRDVGKGLITTIKKMKADSVVDLQAKLSSWLEIETQRENAKRNPKESKLISLQDKYDCLDCFMEGKTSIEEVIKTIESIFTDNKDNPGIVLSSVHKAKGLESKRVFLLQPEGATIPHPMAKSEWQREQEYNLLYVAITRAIEELVFVS